MIDSLQLQYDVTFLRISIYPSNQTETLSISLAREKDCLNEFYSFSLEEYSCIYFFPVIFHFKLDSKNWQSSLLMLKIAFVSSNWL